MLEPAGGAAVGGGGGGGTGTGGGGGGAATLEAWSALTPRGWGCAEAAGSEAAATVPTPVDDAASGVAVVDESAAGLALLLATSLRLSGRVGGASAREVQSVAAASTLPALLRLLPRGYATLVAQRGGGGDGGGGGGAAAGGGAEGGGGSSSLLGHVASDASAYAAHAPRHALARVVTALVTAACEAHVLPRMAAAELWVRAVCSLDAADASQQALTAHYTPHCTLRTARHRALRTWPHITCGIVHCVVGIHACPAGVRRGYLLWL